MYKVVQPTYTGVYARACVGYYVCIGTVWRIVVIDIIIQFCVGVMPVAMDLLLCIMIYSFEVVGWPGLYGIACTIDNTKTCPILSIHSFSFLHFLQTVTGKKKPPTNCRG